MIRLPNRPSTPHHTAARDQHALSEIFGPELWRTISAFKDTPSVLHDRVIPATSLTFSLYPVCGRGTVPRTATALELPNAND